jgi:hypothetical protein
VIGLTGVILYGLLDPQYFPFPKCPFRSFTGLLCPGCGSQRAIHQILHGNFYNAFQLNMLLLPALLYAITGYGIALFKPALWLRIRLKWFGARAAWISLVIILLFWITRNLC